MPPIEGRAAVTIRIDPLRLGDGSYFLSLACHAPDHKTQYHRL